MDKFETIFLLFNAFSGGISLAIAGHFAFQGRWLICGIWIFSTICFIWNVFQIRRMGKLRRERIELGRKCEELSSRIGSYATNCKFFTQEPLLWCSINPVRKNCINCRDFESKLK